MNYYNENDPYAVQWLRNLIVAGLIPPGKVDNRSIENVEAAELARYTQCHFFAGIAGWSLALQLAGWPSDREVWTGSCPCQSISSAGKRQGEKDKRHLWPEFYRLIGECRPSTIFGEQVASGDGPEWIDGVSLDLEEFDYAVGAADLCAASGGAPHIRQRFLWLANSSGQRCNGKQVCLQRRKSQQNSVETAGGGGLGGVAYSTQKRINGSREAREGGRSESSDGGGLGDFWSNFDLIPCRDGKTRRVESGTFPLAHGVPKRVGKLRAYGNAIVPQVAAEFIRAAIERQ